MFVHFLIIGKLMSILRREVAWNNNSVCLLICQYHLLSCGNHRCICSLPMMVLSCFVLEMKIVMVGLSLTFGCYIYCLKYVNVHKTQCLATSMLQLPSWYKHFRHFVECATQRWKVKPITFSSLNSHITKEHFMLASFLLPLRFSVYSNHNFHSCHLSNVLKYNVNQSM
jgi:hypothetical protein